MPARVHAVMKAKGGQTIAKKNPVMPNHAGKQT